MNSAIFWANVRMSRGVVLAWGGSLLLMGLFVAILYDSFKALPGLKEYLDALPEQMKLALGIRNEADLLALLPMGIFSLEAWLSMEFLTWWPVILVIYAIFAAGGTIAGEVDQRTLDLLLSQPITRFQVLTSKTMAFLANLTALALASFVGVILGLALIGESVGPMALALALLQGWLLVVAIAGYCILFSCLFLDPRRTRIAAGLLTAVLYTLSFIGPTLGLLRWLERISPFYYFNATDIMLSARLDATTSALYAAVALAGIAGAMVVFERRSLIS